MSTFAGRGIFFACDTGSSVYSDLRSGLEHIAERLGLHLVVYDQLLDDGVLEKIESLISGSLCLVADVGADKTRPLNSNVMMEIGIARGLGRPLLLVAEEPNNLPSN